MLMPTISVIIPVYNSARTILSTISSVQKQTFSDFEIIAIDDGSPDQSLELIRTVEDERLKVFSYENGGAAIARNRGISRATGEFIAFLDADDIWTPDKLELQLKALQQHPEAGVAYSWTGNMREGELIHRVEPKYEGDIYANLLLWNFLSNGSNPLIRRQAIESVGEFDPAIPHCTDWDYWLRLAARWPFVLVPKIQILYSFSPNAMSCELDKMEQVSLKLHEKAFRAAPVELQYLKKQSLSNIYQYYAELYLRNPKTNAGKVNLVIQNLWKAACLQPQNLLNRYTQALVIKVLLIRILSPGIADRLFGLIGKIRATCNPIQQASN